MNKLLAEFLGTFILIFTGTGAIIINQTSQGTVSHTGIAIIFGLVVFAMIQTFGPVSGCHINPAVSLAAVVWGKLEVKWLGGYIASQVAGALSASVALRFLFPDNEFLGGTQPAGAALQSLILEYFLTFFLMVTVIGCVSAPSHTHNMIGPAVGAVICLEAMFAGPICGASMNPARSLAPAVVSGHLENLWIYFVGPIGGAISAVLIAPLVFNQGPANDTNA